MNTKYTLSLAAASVTALVAGAVVADGHGKAVADEVIAQQRAALAAATAGAGFGPQAPRDIDSAEGSNPRVYESAPHYTDMNLCNIHFHEGAEHRGGEFTTYAGNGDGKGHGTGFLYSGKLSEGERKPLAKPVGMGEKHRGLNAGDTIEVHYVHTTAQVTPGPTLGACLSDAIMNPQLRVETQVYVLVNDSTALDFTELAAVGEVNGYYQALNIPNDTGTPVPKGSEGRYCLCGQVARRQPI